MNELPADSLRLFDTTGAWFATVHFSVDPDPKRLRGDCIFVVQPEHENTTRGEARWVLKRRVETKGEHRFRIDAAGVLTIESVGFKLEMRPDEEPDSMHTTPSGPQLAGEWAT